MSTSEETAKPTRTQAAAAILIAAAGSTLVQRYGYDWVALHVPWLVKIVGEPFMRFLLNLIPPLLSYWAANKTIVLVGATLALAGVTVLVALPGAFGYWLFGKLGLLLFGLGAFVTLVGCIMKLGDKTDEPAKRESNKPTKPRQENAEAELLASDADNSRQAARLVACAVGIALSSPTQ